MQGVHQDQRAAVDIAFTGGAAVIAKGAVGHRQRTAVVDATAFGRVVVGKGAVDHRRRAAVVIDAATAVGFIVGKGAVFHRQRAGIVECPQVRAVAGRRIVISNRDRIQQQCTLVGKGAAVGSRAIHDTQAGQGDDATGCNGEGLEIRSAVIVGIATDNDPVATAINRDFAAQGQGAAEMDRVIVGKGDHAARTDGVDSLAQ